MARFEFGWAGLLLTMVSGGFGAVGIVALLPSVPGGVTQFVFYSIVLSSIAAIIAAAVEGDDAGSTPS